MIAVVLVFALLAVVFGVIGAWGTRIHNKEYFEGEVRMYGGWTLCAFNGVLAIILLLTCFRWQIGTDTRTGYIYSVDEEFGKGTVHIRLSENAGEDAQEPFCVDGENLEKARKLAGSGKKVIVTLPATGIHFENDFFACTYGAIIEEVESK